MLDSAAELKGTFWEVKSDWSSEKAQRYRCVTVVHQGGSTHGSHCLPAYFSCFLPQLLHGAWCIGYTRRKKRKRVPASFLLPLFYYRPLFSLLLFSAMLVLSLTSFPPFTCFPLSSWASISAQLYLPLSGFLGCSVARRTNLLQIESCPPMTLGPREKIPRPPWLLMSLSGMDTA